MKLESARALKQELREARVGRQAVSQGALPEGALRRHSSLPEVPAPSALALGVSGKDGEYRLAVRILAAVPGIQEEIEAISEKAMGEVDVRVVGRISAQQKPWTQYRCRPLLLGCSIGHVDVTAGTLGAAVRRPGVAQDLLLSNNHILANENRGRQGDEILQQGRHDFGASPADVCGHLEDFVPLKAKGNLVDAAIATIDQEITIDTSTLTGLGTLSGVRTEPLEDDEKIFKVGRTTELTEGFISAFEVDDLAVEFDQGILVFDDQIEIVPGLGKGPFSLGGDSGSLIVDGDARAVGLLFAGNDYDSTYANPIQTVLQKLGVELVH